MEKVPSLVRDFDKSVWRWRWETKWGITCIVITSGEGGLLLVRRTKVSSGSAGRGNAGKARTGATAGVRGVASSSVTKGMEIRMVGRYNRWRGERERETRLLIIHHGSTLVSCVTSVGNNSRSPDSVRPNDRPVSHYDWTR